MSELPQLSSQDIRAVLEKHYAHERHHHLFALFGTASETTLDITRAGRFHVVPVQSELDLRDKLAAYEAPDARAVFLVPWSTQIPMDLAGRFVRGGKVLRVGSLARLQRMFGVAEVQDDARRSPLASHLLATMPSATFPTSGGRLTEAAMWAAWLAQRFELDAEGGLGLDTLLGWAATDGRGPERGAQLSSSAPKVREALLTFLSGQLGPAAPAVWQAWERGGGASALAWAVLCEGFTKLPETAQLWLRQRLKQELGIDATSDASRAGEDLGRALGGALAFLSRRTHPHDRQRLLASADALIDEPSVRTAMHGHKRLPSAWQARLDALGAVLAQAAEAPDAEALERASDALDKLHSHELFPEERETQRVKRALMAVRLLAWLVARTDRRTEGQAAPHGDAVALAGWYAAEGGYLDWARGFARGSEADAFGRGVQAVVSAADAARQQLDRRFASGLVAWVEAKRPSGEVVGIDQALRRFGATFLAGDPERRLLVLLMDGMAWAQAVELLQALGERSMAWGPLAWHATAEGRLGSAPVPAVLATLPTTTEISRAAFFAGKVVGAGEQTSSAKDPERFEQHRWLRELCGHDSMPRLLLRAEGSTAGGAASQEALTLVEDTKRRVVGMVVNAIDASLKRDPQQHTRWDVDGIRPLAELLDAAQRAGRSVLLASDHGHVPTDLLKRVGDSASSGGARWRPWEGGGDTLGEDELRFSGEGVWSPKGKDAVVLLATDRVRYGSAPNAGEHGGATLAEVVAPCVLIGSASAVDDHDPALRVVGAHVPDWWLLRLGRAGAVAAVAPPSTRPRSKPKKTSEAQLELLGAPPPPAVVSAPAPSGLADHPLSRSELFTKMVKAKTDREAALRAVEFLHGRSGAASAEAFAAAMGELTWRVPGLVSKLQGMLNVDGYQVLWFDQGGKQVRLDVAKLEQQFEVKL